MRFYTNVQMVGDQILIRGYEDGKGSQTGMYINQQCLFHLNVKQNTKH